MDILHLRGRALYDALLPMKPEGMSLTQWAVGAGLGRTFFNDLKSSPRLTPRSASLAKLLSMTEPKPESSGESLMTFRAINELPRNVPVMGLATGADLKVRDNGHAHEVERLFMDRDTIGYLRRTPAIAHNGLVYALYVQGDSMFPKHASGDPIYVDPRREPMIGDDAVVQLAGDAPEGANDSEIVSVLIKEVARRSGTYIELKQYNPDLTFRIEKAQIQALHRVIPARELLS